MPELDAYRANDHSRVGSLLLEAFIYLANEPLRSTTILRLDEIIKTGSANAEELASLRQNIDALRSGIQLTEIGPEPERQLSRLPHLSDTALQVVTQHRILNSLSFGEIHKRFQNVQTASYKTFEWILEETPKSKTENEAEAMKGSFREWLISGNGVFHIAGKLGSGKLTLLKFLKKHHRITELLEIWASGRQLSLPHSSFGSLGMRWRTQSMASSVPFSTIF
jgi:hypothetical protein